MTLKEYKTKNNPKTKHLQPLHLKWQLPMGIYHSGYLPKCAISQAATFQRLG